MTSVSRSSWFAGLVVVIVAAFAPSAGAATLTIDIEGSGGATGGVIDGTGAGDGTGRSIDCSGPPSTGMCSASFSDQTVQLALTATPGPGSIFAGWSGTDPISIPEDNCYGPLNPCMVWLSTDRTLTATFIPAPNASTLTIDIAGSGGATGTVIGGGALDPIDCHGPPATGKCSTLFPEHSAQGGLTAVPGPSSVFVGWSGWEDGGMFIPEDNCGGTVNPCMVWLSGMDDRAFTATFAPADDPPCMFEPWLCPPHLPPEGGPETPRGGDGHAHGDGGLTSAATAAPSVVATAVIRAGHRSRRTSAGRSRWRKANRCERKLRRRGSQRRGAAHRSPVRRCARLARAKRATRR
jgi:hypothetical protein